LPPFDDQDVVRHRADAHHVLADTNGQWTARCSLWWRNTPALAGHQVGLIGHYAANSGEAGEKLLQKACAELRANRCTLAVGPMDGSTWRRYRFVTQIGNAPSFFLEPENPPEWPRYFERTGFKPAANYYSSVSDVLDYEDPKAKVAEQRLSVLGVKLRPLEMDRWEDELREVYRITTACFQGGFLYQPLSEAEFLGDYRQIKPFVRPELVIFAMHRNRMVGFVFNIPDVLQARRGELIDTVILKTLAIVPDRTYAGLGSYLTQQTNRVARKLGYRRVIHALMHEKNVSLNISARYANPFRRYVLLARPL
jgi:GNAT superfamily N-acetyltransferase